MLQTFRHLPVVLAAALPVLLCGAPALAHHADQQPAQQGQNASTQHQGDHQHFHEH